MATPPASHQLWGCLTPRTPKRFGCQRPVVPRPRHHVGAYLSVHSPRKWRQSPGIPGVLPPACVSDLPLPEIVDSGAAVLFLWTRTRLLRHLPQQPPRARVLLPKLRHLRSGRQSHRERRRLDSRSMCRDAIPNASRSYPLCLAIHLSRASCSWAFWLLVYVRL